METKTCKVCTKSYPTNAIRPYGKNGSDICFGCAMSTPEHEAECKRQMNAHLEKLSGKTVVFTDDGPPEELDATNGKQAVAILGVAR